MSTLTALITGASSGIGLELAKTMAQQGHTVILLARTAAALEQLAQELRQQYKVEAHVVLADLRQPAALNQIAEELARRQLRVDILVNNAGFGLLGPIAELDPQQQLDMIQVNVAALAGLTRLFLPGMIERKAGGVLNVASTASFQSGPNMAVYYASKAFVLSYTEALREEVAGTGLRVSCLCPGPTHTGFVAVAKMEGINLFKFGAHSAQQVAQFGYAAYQANQAIAIPGLKNKLLAFGSKMSPRFLSRKIAMVMNG
jgi:short-subunit dehydrogenase